MLWPFFWGRIQIRCKWRREAEQRAKCLARRWAFPPCCEWRCGPGRGGKVTPSFGSLEGEESNRTKPPPVRRGHSDWGNAHMNYTHTLHTTLWYLDILASPAAGRPKSRAVISHFSSSCRAQRVKQHFPWSSAAQWREEKTTCKQRPKTKSCSRVTQCTSPEHLH